jgi:hypothetical protein
MLVIAFVTLQTAFRKTLHHLQLPVDPPPLGPAQCLDPVAFLAS